MGLTLKAKITAAKGGTTVQNVTEGFTLGDMTGDQMNQSVFELPDANANAIPSGSVDISGTGSGYWVLLRAHADNAGAVEVIDNDGSTDRDVADMAAGEPYGPVKVRKGHTIKVQGTAGDNVECVVTEP